MHKFLEDTPVRFACHACGKQLQKKIKWMRKNKTLKCKKCGKKIDLAKSEIRKAVKNVDQAMRDFDKALTRLHAAASKKKTREATAKRPSRPASVETSGQLPTSS